MKGRGRSRKYDESKTLGTRLHRASYAFAILSTTLFLFSAAATIDLSDALRNSENTAAVLSSSVFDLTNNDRIGNKVLPLKYSLLLEKVAQAKANDMGSKGYFSHTSPDGTSPWKWFREKGYSYTYAGENLAVYFSDAVELEHAWMNSPRHRANILNNHFSEMGFGSATGTYEGQTATFVVEEFGTPVANGMDISSTSTQPLLHSPGSTLQPALTGLPNILESIWDALSNIFFNSSSLHKAIVL